MKNVVFRTEFKAPSRILNWFPGHMRKAMRMLEGEAKKTSMFIEVRDSRIPLTSHNREVISLLPEKVKRLVVYNKIDLANEKRTIELIKKIHEQEEMKNVPWMHISTKKNINVNKLISFI
jgi:ribosome biogenesis GTPase A